MEEKVKLVIVDDQQIYAEGLRFVIEARAPEFEVVAIAENGQVALDLLNVHRPEMLLMDVRMPVMDGVEATKEVHKRYPEIKILILTTFDDDEYVRQSIEHGAVGYLIKNRPPEEIIASLRALRQGIMQIDPAVSAKLFRPAEKSSADVQVILKNQNSPADAHISNKLETLTERELQILKQLVEAKKITRIATSLGIAAQTVRNHISNIYTKLGIHNQIEIVRYINAIRIFLEQKKV